MIIKGLIERSCFDNGSTISSSLSFQELSISSAVVLLFFMHSHTSSSWLIVLLSLFDLTLDLTLFCDNKDTAISRQNLFDALQFRGQKFLN
jgi:hypothetical protein